MKRTFMLLLTGIISFMSVHAQTKIVTGSVTSSEDNQPIIGVSVVVPGSSTGGVTDLDGRFSISVPTNATHLQFSYIGMQTVVFAIRNNMHVVMHPDSKILDEVVVTAMGISKSQKSIGSSATTVKGDAIAAVRTNDVMSSLSGKVAGVQISNTSSDPGASNSVIIRGFTSLSGNNQPLYVVDGVPLNNTAIYSTDGLNSGYDFGNGSAAVNPDDVDNVTILKGAAATALYGSRAANGVVMITTKSGKSQQGSKALGVSFNSGLQWTTLLRIPEMQNEFGIGWYGDHTLIENGSWGPRFDGSMQLWGRVYENSQKLKPFVAQPNNIKDFFDTGFRYNNSIAFDGASDKSAFYVSFSQISDDGMIPRDKDSYDKYTFSGRGSHTIGNLTFSTSMNYAYQKNRFVTTGQGLSMYNSIMQTPRDVSIISLADLSDPFNTPGYYYTPYGVTNPYYVLENYKNEQELERFYGKFQLDYKFLKYFTFTYRMGLDTSIAHREAGSPNLSAITVGQPNHADAYATQTGSVSQSMTRRREINQDLYINFDMPIEKSEMHVNALIGFNGNERAMKYEYASVTNLTIPTWYDLSNSAEIPTADQSASLRRLMGVYAQAEVSWRNMIYLTLTGRNDWSSTLPKANRSFFYPGSTLSFLFSELLNDELREVISFGKLRAAWGMTGNDADPYMTDPYYGVAGASASGWGSSNFPLNKLGLNAFTVGNIIGSQKLSPEMTTEMEFGLNMAFLNNRINFDVTYYDRVSDKQIFNLNMDPASGYTSQNLNLGEIGNKGIELLVNVTPVKTKSFQWDLGVNYTKNWSKVIDLPDEVGGSSAIWSFSGGTGLYAIEGKELGIYKAVVPKRDDKGNIVVNATTGLPVADAEQEVGSMNYDYMMGLNTTLTYKGVSLKVDFDIRQGGKMFSRTKSIEYFTGNAIQTAYNDRNPFIIPGSVVQKADGTYTENTTALDPTYIYQYWDGGGSDLASGYLIDKSYVKLRSIVLSWQVPQKWFKSTFLRDVNLSAYGNNLFVWTAKSNTFVDPEMTSFGNDLEGQFGEYSANPSSRRFGVNLSVKF